MHWIVKKTLFAAITWFLAISISILIIVLAPGNPALMLLTQFLQSGMSYDRALQMVVAYIGYSPNEPWYNMWMKYLSNVITGNLGVSIVYRTPVAQMIAGAIPWSIFFVSYSLSITLAISILLGLALTYYRRNILFTRTTTSILTILNSIPNWILAAIFFVYIGARWKLLPYMGPYSSNVVPGLNAPFILSVLHHYTLPMLVMVLTSLPGWTFGMAAMSSSVIREDYVVAARARGLPSRRILTAYIAKNSILPIYANIGVTFAWLLVGTVWIESQFLLPGLGTLLSVTSSARDYPVMVGTYVIVITAIILANFLTDITYGLIDPRARVEEQ
ncbi:ABC transporter permease [Ignisphaera sp. 4213-co]|uniref:ABC transporter permease n=1 Tax=Ignisphaera cupida TaxID=3050454 RepID=A0ABD4Z8A8_9CREN|nr:ABC transporter permease [Ignisphaera sp. 4213-co]MDK6029450.1 ABC transporter permease [Ignisphaera sp. 4213-co]